MRENEFGLKTKTGGSASTMKGKQRNNKNTGVQQNMCQHTPVIWWQLSYSWLGTRHFKKKCVFNKGRQQKCTTVHTHKDWSWFYG